MLVGEGVGGIVGAGVGGLVGAGVGSLVGTAVGDGVGAVVGADVGAGGGVVVGTAVGIVVVESSSCLTGPDQPLSSDAAQRYAPPYPGKDSATPFKMDTAWALSTLLPVPEQAEMQKPKMTLLASPLRTSSTS